jgi:hypothetical protein
MVALPMQSGEGTVTPPLLIACCCACSCDAFAETGAITGVSCVFSDISGAGTRGPIA